MALYRGCRLFLNGFAISDTVSYSPPEVAIEKGLFKAGAMNAAAPVDRGTKPLTAMYKIYGMSPASFLFFGFIPGVRTRLTVRRVFRDDEGVHYLEDEIEGFIESVKPDEHGSDNKSDVGHSMVIAADFYKISLNGVTPLIEINTVLGLRKVFGVNVLGIPGNIMSLIL